MLLNLEQFGELFMTFASSATRIETLDEYRIDYEQEQLALYFSGAPLPERNLDWANNIRECVRSGKYMGRVHIIPHVLTPYLQFEIDWYYTVNGAAGEDIRFIFREDVPDIAYSDTWIFDDKVVVDLTYGDDGSLLHIERNDSPARLKESRTAWNELFRRSFPLADLMAKIRTNNLVIP